MKTFRTIVSTPASKWQFGLKNPVFTAGSCFADAIGSRLYSNKFEAMVNPFGIIYNPLSIHRAILYGLSNTLPGEDTFLENDGIHLSYDFHSEVAAYDKKELMSTITSMVSSAHGFLKNTSRLLITYGTAWVYERTDTHEIVANCHKVPAAFFKKRLLSEQEIVASFKMLFDTLKAVIPDAKLIITVSPVRHVKDTLPLNSVSKAVLRTACYAITTQFTDVEYFPAFEIMMDDLRDYRFYKSDMLHPTQEAEDYIWDQFIESYIDEDTRKFIKEWKSISAAMSHRPFHPTSASHQKFLNDTLKRLELLKDKADVSEEIRIIKEQITTP
ncbi:GSCFA domain-containing protein [Chryseosolibacter indicus]|uniref:GSCFA domain-containing protein n=1 Tax=Chryseosolibacter indicus TaxID=2782351 RepID=A0ABS5VTS6_9BACT|nr:GSCFA domain-containing protein [Chryseosolibacter indicus]MBT1704832.1 GSCFA domain-containing protein [Chryseosolibacter indicus]